MDFKLELVFVPVTDVDRAKDFYVRAGFNADQDHQVNDELRFVQLTPPGSACSIAIGTGLTEMAPGSLRASRWWCRRRRGAGVLVERGIDAAREELRGSLHGLRRADGNVAVQQRPDTPPQTLLARPTQSGEYVAPLWRGAKPTSRGPVVGIDVFFLERPSRDGGKPVEAIVHLVAGDRHRESAFETLNTRAEPRCARNSRPLAEVAGSM